MSKLHSVHDWWKHATVYHVYPRSFADSNGDGEGDLRGVISKLDYLETLGVDVVWLSPFFRSPHHDNGYDVSDYCDVDPVFGALNDVDELIGELHARGMKLMIDVVMNHSSDQHPWFIESRSSLDNPKRDWYWWRPARPGTSPGDNGAEPTNWMSHFSEPAWSLDETTGEYYLHLFSRHQPDLNWENPAVRRAMYEILLWWLDRGVDGFRMDVLNMMSKRLPLRDGPALPGSSLGNGQAEFINGPRMHEFVRELNDQVIAPHDGTLITVGETPGVTVQEALRYTDPARREIDMVFHFEHMEIDRGPHGRFDVEPVRIPELKACLDRWQTGLAAIGWNSLYWGNHDQPRAVSRFGSDHPDERVASAKLLATVLHLQRGTPYIYQGDELGMTNYPFTSLDEYRDIESINWARHAGKLGVPGPEIVNTLRHASRDNARTPMQWDHSRHGGFTTGTPWIAVNPNHQEISARAQMDDSCSVFHHHRQLIAMRHDLPVVAHGDFHLLLPDHDQILAFTRVHENHELLVLTNFSNTSVTADFEDAPRWSTANLLLTNLSSRPAPLSTTMRLEPWEALVYLLRPADLIASWNRGDSSHDQ